MADNKSQDQTTAPIPVPETIPADQPTQHPPAYDQTAPSNTEKGLSEKRVAMCQERFRRAAGMIGRPLNKAANIIGAEGWWPASMEKECNKAARILHSFTRLGGPEPPRTNGPFHPTGLTRKSVIKIPEPVLRSCAGLAIFNTFRFSALQGTLAVGSGVVVARRQDGSWSPPSAFVVTTLGAGFSMGLDIYECVCVLNTPEQVAAFTHPRLSLGGEAAISVGPVGTGRSVEAALSSTSRPMWSYMKSRGLWVGIQVDGTIVVSRSDANAVAYGEKDIPAAKILTGDVAWTAEGKALFDVLMSIDGAEHTAPAVPVRQAIEYYPGNAVEEKPEVEPDDEKTEKEEEEGILDEKKRLPMSGY